MDRALTVGPASVILLSVVRRSTLLEYMLQVSGEAEDFQEFLFDLWRGREEIKAERAAPTT